MLSSPKRKNPRQETALELTTTPELPLSQKIDHFFSVASTPSGLLLFTCLEIYHWLTLYNDFTDYGVGPDMVVSAHMTGGVHLAGSCT
jgi:hypothetical protein